MPPKKKPVEPSKKTDQKKKEKIIEDKTFGLKNKKGAKNQKFIQQVQHQVKFGNQSARKADALKPADKKKEEKKKEIDELNNLFKPVTVQKIEKGADPKSVLCAFYKQGQCTKGDKCKFSHDLSLERKSEKRNMYVDVRDGEEGVEDLQMGQCSLIWALMLPPTPKELIGGKVSEYHPRGDVMENWDEEKLKEVVEKKHGEAERKMPKTDIICRYFLDALENNKYGWFWECPNGASKCHYRHALPPGFVLKKDKKKEDKREELSIEDLVERQRAQLGSNLTRITFETFQIWKKQKLAEKREKAKKEEDRKRAEFKAGRSVGLSGRDMFTFRPELADEDLMEEGEAAFDVRMMEDEEDEKINEVKEVSVDELAVPLDVVGDGGTIASVRHWQKEESALLAEGGDTESKDDAVPIDENLFEDDLDDMEEELGNLNVD